MARFFPLLLAFMVFSATTVLNADKDDKFIKASEVLGRKHEKLSHLHLYWHDIVGGQHPSGVNISPPVKNSTTFFGMTRIIDNPLTLGPNATSECVGRAQGFYASTGLDEVALYTSMNFEFSSGKYNGSTITVQGRNPVFNKVREMAVVGGSGLFRFARGYALANTVLLDLNTGDATVEYNVYVLHY